ncbi:MAG: hypothetical protein Q7L55_05750 [Actinomycetota bacterium]|nr:hypothetical protein [Actinomycetota bacterium]
MLGWIKKDAEGLTFVMRSGTGRVTAVVPVADNDDTEKRSFHTVELDVDRPPGHSRSIRLSAQARVCEGDELHHKAVACQARDCAVSWSIAWHRHSGVPDDVPVTSLDLQHETQAWLAELDDFVDGELAESDWHSDQSQPRSAHE